MARKSTATRVRSAITGRFVRKSQARRNPAATITERIRGKRKKRK
jgi:hypothetical protein